MTFLLESESSESDSDFETNKGKEKDKEEEGSSSEDLSSGDSDYEASSHPKYDLKLKKAFVVAPAIAVETDLLTGNLFYKIPRVSTDWDVRSSVSSSVIALFDPIFFQVEVDSQADELVMVETIKTVIAGKKEVEEAVLLSSKGMIPDKVSEQADLENPAPLPVRGDPRLEKALNQDQPEEALATLIQRPIEVKEIHQSSTLSLLRSLILIFLFS